MQVALDDVIRYVVCYGWYFVVLPTDSYLFDYLENHHRFYLSYYFFPFLLIRLLYPHSQPLIINLPFSQFFHLLHFSYSPPPLLFLPPSHYFLRSSATSPSRRHRPSNNQTRLLPHPSTATLLPSSPNTLPQTPPLHLQFQNRLHASTT